MYEPAEPVLFRIVRMREDQKIEDLPRFIKRLAPQINCLQIRQHPREDLARTNGRQNGGVQTNVNPSSIPRQIATVLKTENATAMEGIDPVSGVCVLVDNDEVPGKSDT